MTTEEKALLNNGVPKSESNGTVKVDKRKEKNKLKKKKKKQNKQQKKQEKITAEDVKKENQLQDIEVEYVLENPLAGMDENDPAFAEFSEIFEKFKEAAQAEAQTYQSEDITGKPETQDGTTENADSDDEEAAKKEASNKQKKKQRRLSLAVLKQLVKRPDLVEGWDATSQDPLLLVYLKGYKNTVPVPVHWSQKRKYLQGKRGVEKPAFQLPEFIEATGVANLRKGTQNAQKSLKQKQREKMNAKVGRMEFDYQVLHDAFFKYQTKPKLTKHGDLYYEGKEFEITLREKRPGVLSEELKRALGMPEGAPPPWLFNMQRFGPPPSYPNLKIPGVNAPLPEGARYGYHPGGWGKPPVDEFNRPLYGDVFGTAPEPPPEITQPIERRHWGEAEAEEEEAMEQETEEVPQEGEDEEPHPSGFETPSGLETPSGMETPETIELRKAPAPLPKKPVEPEDESEKQLFHVIKEQEVSVGGATMYGSSHRYVVPSKGASNKVDLMKSQATEKLDLSLNPSEVESMEELTEELLAKKYEAARQEKKDTDRKEDVTDLVKEQLQKKRKKKEGSDDKKAKKYKEFKF